MEFPAWIMALFGLGSGAVGAGIAIGTVRQDVKNSNDKIKKLEGVEVITATRCQDIRTSISKEFCGKVDGMRNEIKTIHSTLRSMDDKREDARVATSKQAEKISSLKSSLDQIQKTQSEMFKTMLEQEKKGKK